jgi:hypothetical protein
LLAQRQSCSWTSERAWKILKESAMKWMGVDGLNISGYRQIAIHNTKVGFSQPDFFSHTTV